MINASSVVSRFPWNMLITFTHAQTLPVGKSHRVVHWAVSQTRQASHHHQPQYKTPGCSLILPTSSTQPRCAICTFHGKGSPLSHHKNHVSCKAKRFSFMGKRRPNVWATDICWAFTFLWKPGFYALSLTKLKNYFLKQLRLLKTK